MTLHRMSLMLLMSINLSRTRTNSSRRLGLVRVNKLGVRVRVVETSCLVGEVVETLDSHDFKVALPRLNTY